MSGSNNGGTHTSVHREAGLRFTAVIRGHSIVMDQPPANGGQDAAATPMELLGASLGGCVALYVHQFCAARNIDDDELRVEIIAENARKPYRVGRFVIGLTLPASFPEEYREAVERVVKTCPVHNTFVHPPQLELEIRAAAAV